MDSRGHGGLEQHEVAEELGLSVSHVRHMEKDILGKLHDALPSQARLLATN